MTPRSPAAYLISALLHGAVAALVLIFSYAAESVVNKEQVKVFELVAGAGDNYAATVAPALGVPRGLRTAPPQPAPAPPTPAPAAPEAAPSAPPKPAPKPDLVSTLKRTEARREARLEARYKKEQEAERKREAEEEKVQQAAEARAKAARVDSEGIREGVLGGSVDNKVGGAGGKALTREEGSELEAYFALLKSRIRENHVPPEGVSDSLVARVEFLLASNGTLSEVRIARSSGNADFDRSVLEACQRTRSIGPRPDGRADIVSMDFKIHEDTGP